MDNLKIKTNTGNWATNIVCLSLVLDWKLWICVLTLFLFSVDFACLRNQQKIQKRQKKNQKRYFQNIILIFQTCDILFEFLRSNLWVGRRVGPAPCRSWLCKVNSPRIQISHSLRLHRSTLNIHKTFQYLISKNYKSKSKSLKMSQFCKYNTPSSAEVVTSVMSNKLDGQAVSSYSSRM